MCTLQYNILICLAIKVLCIKGSESTLGTFMKIFLKCIATSSYR